MGAVRSTGTGAAIDESRHVSAYAYTNEHEFFAVMAEYFFTSPELLKRRDPVLYAMLRDMFHQNTGSLLPLVPWRCQVIGRNAHCPGGSGRQVRAWG